MGQRKARIVNEHAGSDLYPIRPSEVPLLYDSTGLSTFGSAEVEEVAGHLVRFFQSRGYWCEFTIEELAQFYKERGWNPNAMFYGLMGTYLHFGGCDVALYMREEPLLVVDSVGKYNITNFFIERCMSAADPTDFLEMVGELAEHIREVSNSPKTKGH